MAASLAVLLDKDFVLKGRKDKADMRGLSLSSVVWLTTCQLEQWVPWGSLRMYTDLRWGQQRWEERGAARDTSKNWEHFVSIQPGPVTQD